MKNKFHRLMDFYSISFDGVTYKLSGHEIRAIVDGYVVGYADATYSSFKMLVSRINEG